MPGALPVRLYGLLLAALLWPPAAAAQDVEADPDMRANAPVRHPVAAWQRALQALPAGSRVRRLAFAEHILFVFYSPAGGDVIDTLTLTPVADGFVVEFEDPRDPSLCQAPGVDADRVQAGLDRVLASPDWQQHRAAMDSLILECMGPALAWTLIPIPPGGYRAGVPLATISLPFEPDAAPALPKLERE